MVAPEAAPVARGPVFAPGAGLALVAGTACGAAAFGADFEAGFAAAFAPDFEEGLAAVFAADFGAAFLCALAGFFAGAFAAFFRAADFGAAVFAVDFLVGMRAAYPFATQSSRPSRSPSSRRGARPPQKSRSAP
jgi:hypothetical protein